MNQNSIYKSPPPNKSKGRRNQSLVERNGLFYLQPGTELCSPQPSMTNANLRRRLEIIENGCGNLDPNTGNVFLVREYQVDSESMAWRLIMGNDDGNYEWQPSPVNFNLNMNVIEGMKIVVFLLILIF